MSGDVTYELGEGILRIPKGERESGRFGSVALAEDEGMTILTGVPKGIRAALIAVKVKRFTTTRKRWFSHGVTVRTKAVEIPVLLGVGIVFTASLGTVPTPDAVGVKPDRPSPAPWLDITALKEVEGQWVRLELLRTTEHRAEEANPEPSKEA